MLFRTLLRAASAWFIWRWLEPRWRSTLALITGWLLVSVLHGEYVEFVQITNRVELLWLSYVIKWVLVLSAIAAYIWFSVLAPKTPPPPSQPAPAAQGTARVTAPRGDGFDFLRDKGQLQSRADKVLDAQRPTEISTQRQQDSPAPEKRLQGEEIR